MYARLISYSQVVPDLVEAEDLDTALDLIAYCAKVSNPQHQINKETSEKLVKYLIKHKHWSPLEMVSACIEVETTRDIMRQMLRHRSFSFQEFSQRYAEISQMDNQYVIREARLEDTENRQNSIDVDDAELQAEWAKRQQAVIDLCNETYNWARDKHIAKEQARVVLPEGNTVSRAYANGTLRSWLHYIDLRAGNGTQKEHIELAVECARAIHAIFPLDIVKEAMEQK